MTFGSSDSAGFTFDPNSGRMTQYKETINGTAVSGDLTWNANGTLRQLAVTDPFNSADAQTCTYLYDDLGRIGVPPGSTGKSVDCGATKWQQIFSYDAFGNITKTVPPGGTGTSFQPTYNNKNQYQTLPGFTPSYDAANGNLTADSFHTYAWDAEGRPVSVDTIGLTYDALGREVEENNTGVYTQYVYALGQKLALMTGQTQTRAYVPLPGGTQAVYSAGAIQHFRVPDWLGSMRIGSTTARAYSFSQAFAPFGERYATGGSAAYQTFTGQNNDTAGDLYDFLFREEHGAQGRWISPDPAGLASVNPVNPQTWNRYGYVANMPLNSVDPTGLADCKFSRFWAGGPPF